MRKVQILFGLALLALVSMSSAANAVTLTETKAPGGVVPNAVVVTYNPEDGAMSYGGNGYEITTFELKSAANLFDPSKGNAGVGPFDVFTAAKYFTLTTAPNQVTGADIGGAGVYPAGKSAADLIADFALGGSLYPKGGLETATGGGPYLYVVPEPSSIALVSCGLLGLLGLRRKQG